MIIYDLIDGAIAIATKLKFQLIIKEKNVHYKPVSLTLIIKI